MGEDAPKLGPRMCATARQTKELRLQAEHRDHVWSYDFVEAHTHDGRRLRMLNVVDEFSRECLAIRVARKLEAADVIDVLSNLFILRGVPSYIRSDDPGSRSASLIRRPLQKSAPRRRFSLISRPRINNIHHQSCSMRCAQK